MLPAVMCRAKRLAGITRKAVEQNRDGVAAPPWNATPCPT